MRRNLVAIGTFLFMAWCELSLSEQTKAGSALATGPNIYLPIVRHDQAPTPTSTSEPTPTAEPIATPTMEPSSTSKPTATTEPTVTHTPTFIPTMTYTSTATPPVGSDPILVGAGDIASCSSSGDEATSTLLDGIVGTVFTLGDNVYDSGTASEYTNCYDPSWGRHKSRTRPVPGNHDYQTAGASGYYTYFGAAAGDPSKGYYSYELGTWHIVALNSNVSMAAGSAQEQWLRRDLAAHPTTCTLAYWHHPRFSSTFGSSMASQPLWQALYDANADVILAGHAHNYERFAPQDPGGRADTLRGIRQFVVGSGGKSLHGFGTILPTSEMRNADTNGVLKLTLHATSFDFEFVPEAGKTFTDKGTNVGCH